MEVTINLVYPLILLSAVVALLVMLMTVFTVTFAIMNGETIKNKLKIFGKMFFRYGAFILAIDWFVHDVLRVDR